MEPNNKQNGRSWTEYFRVITPVLVTIGVFMLGQINTQVTDLNNKIFKHLTNDDIHTPRGMMVGKGEFEIVQKFRDMQLSEFNVKLDKNMCDIKDTLKDLQAELKRKK